MPPRNLSARRTQLEASFLAGLGPLRQSVRRAFDRELASFGLSRALAAPLVRIGDNDGMRQCELADQLDIEGPSLVRLLDQLTADGLVVRRTDSGDQRVRTLHLTSDGKDVAMRIAPIVDRVRAQVLTDVSDDELETCVRVLAGVSAACQCDASEPTT